MELEVLEALEALEVLEVLEVIEAVMEAMEAMESIRPSDMAREMPMLLGIVAEVMEAMESVTIPGPSAMAAAIPDMEAMESIRPSDMAREMPMPMPMPMLSSIKTIMAVSQTIMTVKMEDVLLGTSINSTMQVHLLSTTTLAMEDMEDMEHIEDKEESKVNIRIICSSLGHVLYHLDKVKYIFFRDLYKLFDQTKLSSKV